MRVDMVATQPQYLDHLLPVWRALGAAAGTVYVSPQLLPVAGVDAQPLAAASSPDVVLTAGYTDFARARRLHPRLLAYMEHGCGQSYGADPRSAHHPAYAGGGGREGVGLILAPNQQAAARWEGRYPGAAVHVVGATRVLTPPEDARAPLLCVSFHWDGPIPETRSALRHYAAGLADLARRVPVIGHGHPRAAAQLRRLYQRAGIEWVPDLREVAQRATVYAVDNSSTLWELGRTRPVVAMDAPWYRRDHHHGLRFWSHIPGPSVSDPDGLAHAARQLLTDESAAERRHRERVVAEVIPHTDGALRAATLIREWAA